MTESARMKVLEALHRKWEKDHGGEMPKYPSKYCHWELRDGKRIRIPDEDIADLAERFSNDGINEAVDRLKADGLIDLFDSGLDVYFMLTGNGVATITALQKSVGSYWAREHSLRIEEEQHRGR